MRAAPALSSLLLLALLSGPALAQAPAQAPAQLPPEQAATLSNQEQAAQAADGRRNQRIERITVEDGGSRVDELRVGGQTQSITVTPKVGNGLPEYEVVPNNAARDSGPSRAGAEPAAAPRRWKLGTF